MRIRAVFSELPREEAQKGGSWVIGTSNENWLRQAEGAGGKEGLLCALAMRNTLVAQILKKVWRRAMFMCVS